MQGFESDKAELLIRKSVNAPFEHVPMVFNNDTKTFEGMLFDLPGSIDYFVESGGVKSDVFTMHAADLPYVKQLEMEYVFPAYTGLAPRKIENGGDIAVLQGTQVRVRITPTMTVALGPHPAGRRHRHRAHGRWRRLHRHDPRHRRTASIASSCRAGPRTSS